MVEGMLGLALVVLLQSSLERSILEAEDARVEDASLLVAAVANPDPRIQRLAVRALGRLERPEHADSVVPLLGSSDPGIRMESANALGQMAAAYDLGPWIVKETDGAVRGVLYETMGRLPGADEHRLAAGLEDRHPLARTGAAKGLEIFFRRRNVKPAPETVYALRRAVRRDNPAALRRLALLALNRAGDADEGTLSQALEDEDPQVRRLSVLGLQNLPDGSIRRRLADRVRDDPSHMVRYESLKVAADCELAKSALNDASEHVVLLAIDQLGELGCPAETLETLVSGRGGWRRPSRALVSLAKVSPGSARSHLARFVEHEVWQARAYAARAARMVNDRRALERLLDDPDANVVAAALVEPADAVRALTSPHYGLLMEAAERLKGWAEGRSAVPALLAALERLSAERRATSRDPRRQLLERLRELGDSGIVSKIRPLLSDFDPAIAGLAADIVSEKSGQRVRPETTRLVTEPPPPEPYIRGLQGATARVRMKEAGVFVLELVPQEAPVTVGAFARLAEKGYYNGLTFHRIVPNFVIQGGSPGANEYVGTPGYIRDELGLLSHVRGTAGISTRGRDTGDSQIFISLVDNYRLDHDYTVFARVVEGMEAVDRVQEGDVIESVEIMRPGRE